jgi:hypothetical protein
MHIKPRLVRASIDITNNIRIKFSKAFENGEDIYDEEEEEGKVEEVQCILLKIPTQM